MLRALPIFSEPVQLLEALQARFPLEEADKDEVLYLHHWLKACADYIAAVPEQAEARFDALLQALAAQPERTAILGQALHRWLLQVKLYPALVRLGILSRRGVVRELSARLYDRLNPPPRDPLNAYDALALLFSGQQSRDGLASVSGDTWRRCYALLCTGVETELLQQTRWHWQQDALYALEMLAIWVAAEEIEPELIRIDPRLVNIDSAFIALQRELHLFAQHQLLEMREPGQAEFDAGHLWVMLDQCHDQIARLRRKGAGAAGFNLAVAHLIERLEQTLQRLEVLLELLSTRDPEQRLATAFGLWQQLVTATLEKRSLSRVWGKSVQLLAKSITQNKSDHGEEYIARDAKAYWRLMRSAAGAGVIIACMALMKIQIETWGWAPLAQAVAVSLNYGLGFVLVHLLHFTIATKQPAMTAASFAAAVEQGERGRAAHKKLASLLIDVNRSQWAAVWGNVSTAVLVAILLSGISLWLWHRPPLDAEQVSYQLAAIHPLAGLALLYAAIAGVWLFCSGVIAGYFDNRADYLQLRVRLEQHPRLAWMQAERRARLAAYLHEHSGAILGNFLFGMMLGMTGYLGYLLGVPLDIRHVAFSSANLGYVWGSAPLSVWELLLNLLFVLLIGFVNLWVSFVLALFVALRSRGVKMGRWSNLGRSLWDQFKAQPLRFFFPLVSTRQRDDSDAASR
ncbi:recombinase [Marinospirillum sp.]|uniref:recombinase n=1 Tax=Marinospirillum sp. TaxID=2183934 RepID=UPI003A8C88F0